MKESADKSIFFRMEGFLVLSPKRLDLERAGTGCARGPGSHSIRQTEVQPQPTLDAFVTWHEKV